jgi:uncharacterized DUF497 family protein
VPVVHRLKVPDFARVKLGRRGISVEEAEQVRRNEHVFEENRRAPSGTSRLFLIGLTNGGRRLTLVVEPTADPTAWRVITGWDS